MTRPRPSTVPPDPRREPPREDDRDRYDLGELELAAWPRPSLPQPGGDALDEPDLLPVSRPANDVAHPGGPDLPAPRAPSVPAHTSGARELGDDLEDGASGPMLELDVSLAEGMRLHSHPSLPTSSSRPPRGAPRAGAAQRAPGSDRPVTRERPSGRADDGVRAARALAGYGPPPQGLFAAAGYVIRVAKRMRILREERRALEKQARGEADAHGSALATLGAVLMREPALLGHAALEEARARVTAHEAELAARSAAATASRESGQVALAQLAQRQKSLEAELAPYLAAERAAASAQVRSEAELKRRRAQEQRLDIELRALERASIPAPAERKSKLEQERGARAADTAAHLRAHEETTRALGLARRELALRRGHLDVLEREHSQHNTRARRLDARLEDDVTRARQALDAQRAALAEAARALGLTSPSSAEVAQVIACEQRLDALLTRLAAYDRALDLYDLAGLVKGAIVWMGLLLVGVLATWLLTTPG